MSARLLDRRGVAVLCVVFGAAAVWFTSYFWPGAATEREVARFLSEKAAAGDLVVVTPAGSLDRLRAYTRLGLSALSAADDRIAIKSGFARSWLVGAHGSGAPPTIAPGARIVERHLVAGTAVWLVSRDAEAASTQGDVRALLRGARATVRASSPGSPERECPREGERFRCGSEGWQWLGPETITVRGERRACLWAHPIAGQIVALELPSLAGASAVKLTTLLSDAATARTHGAPVEVTVRAAAKELLRFSHGALAPQREHDLVLDGTPPRLELAALQDGVAHFCLIVRRMK